MKCKICNSDTKKIFTKKILKKYDVNYHQCGHCKFLFTDEPYWLNEAYASAFTSTDTGLLARVLQYGKIVEGIIVRYYNKDSIYLDFGGGNGLFTRYMRDLGMNFYRYDKYAENIYSTYFDFKLISEEKRKFELITSMEVMEHLENPMETFDELFSMTDNLFFTTFLQPKKEELSNWWYISNIHGQHIAFYHKETLKYIANYFNKKLFTNDNEMHVLTNHKENNIHFELERIYERGPVKLKNKLIRIINKSYYLIYPPLQIQHNKSLTMDDFDYANKINQ